MGGCLPHRNKFILVSRLDTYHECLQNRTPPRPRKTKKTELPFASSFKPPQAGGSQDKDRPLKKQPPLHLPVAFLPQHLPHTGLAEEGPRLPGAPFLGLVQMGFKGNPQFGGLTYFETPLNSSWSLPIPAGLDYFPASWIQAHGWPLYPRLLFGLYPYMFACAVFRKSSSLDLPWTVRGYWTYSHGCSPVSK